MNQPLEFVPAADTSDDATRCTDEVRRRILVLTLHDGDRVPVELYENGELEAMASDGRIAAAIAAVRDWGADLVAGHLSSALGIAGHHRIGVARAIVDFNRFPGLTRDGSRHVEQLALGGPLADAMTAKQRRHVLSAHYDAISERLDELISEQLMILSVHTYDERNSTDTQRPEVSLLSRSDSYQRDSHLPFGLFDPLFPDVLTESSAKRVLRDRMALTLEKAGVYVEHNYPYCLPDGSIEIRSQPWFFFQKLREDFEKENPETHNNPAFSTVWEMLSNTNLRRADAGALSRYLHRFCEAPVGQELEFQTAASAYGAIRAFLTSRPNFVHEYRRSLNRTSAITVEVRKDLVWNFDADGRPLGPNEKQAQRIARLLATGISTFLHHDRTATN